MPEKIASASGVGARPAGLTPEFLAALHHVLEHAQPGAWGGTLKRIGRAGGAQAAVAIDARLATQLRPALAALPLETALEFLQQHFLAHGWGRLALDLSLAPQHGLVLAQLEHSYAAEVLTDATGCVDAFAAGVLQGYFEYISGDTLDCAEIACVRRGAPRSTFVVTTAERLQPLLPLIGRETADAIIARLRI